MKTVIIHGQSRIMDIGKNKDGMEKNGRGSRLLRMVISAKNKMKTTLIIWIYCR